MAKSAQGHQVVGRRWNYAPPPWRMFEALTDERDRWLVLLTDEATPKVTRAIRPSVVVYRPWVDRLIDHIQVEISDDGGQGSSLRILATAKVRTLSDEERRRTRHRLGAVFGAALRRWVDEPHR